MADEVITQNTEVVTPPAPPTPPEPPKVDIVEEAKKQIPIEKGKSYSDSEVQKLVNDAISKGAKISKDQLHKEIEAKAQKLKDSENKIAELQKSIETAKNATPTGTEETPELTDLKKRLEVMEKTAVDERINRETLEKTLKVKELDSIRMRLIAEAKGRIVESAVTGSTEEEIKQSVEKAKKQYEDIELIVKKSYNLPTEPVNKPDDAKPVEIQRLPVNDSRAREDYKKQRDEVRSKIYREAGFKV